MESMHGVLLHGETGFLSYFITRITRSLYVLWNTKFANDDIRTIQVAFEICVYPLF